MSEHSLNVAYVGLSGFPFGYAAISRQKLICQGLQNAGASVKVICSRAVIRGNKILPRSGEFEGVSYVYAVNPLRNGSFFIRNLLRFFEPWLELLLLLKLNKQKRFTHVIVSNNNEIINSIWYSAIAKLLGSKVIFSLVELYVPASTQSLKSKLNHYLFLRFGLQLYDAYLPISSYIERYFRNVPRPSLLLPIMVDVDKVTRVEPVDVSGSARFIFCGSAGYPNTIQFCIQSFEQMNNDSAELHIVAGGSDSEMEGVKRLINKSQNANRIKHHSNLSEAELFSLYKSASALLIPLFNTVQDLARFPHKLGEYLATGRPVITSSCCEISHYLRQREQALFAEADNVNQFAGWMDFVIDNPNEAQRIGLEGRHICIEKFNHLKLGALLYDFLKKM